MPASLSIISAMDENNLIGFNNQLPWHMPADLGFFKKTTMHKPILMGRKTFESIGKPLPGRHNIIISRNPEFQINGCETCDSVETALTRVDSETEAFLIGGASLYEQTINMADALYITEIHAKFDGDAWFPQIDKNKWQESWRENHQANEKNKYDYSFVKYLPHR